MLKKTLVLFLLLFMCSCSFIFDKTYRMSFKEKSPDNIAVLLPLTGKYAKTGKSLLNIIHFAYNKNSNSNIVLNIYDTGSNVQNITPLVEEILKDDNKAILGPLLSSETKLLADLLKSYSIPIFSFSNDQTILNSANNVYMLSPLLSVELKTTIDFLHKNLNSNNFALLVPENNFGDTAYTELKQYFNYFNIPLTKEVRYPTNTTRLKPYIERLVSKEELTKYEEIRNKLDNQQEVFDQDNNLITEIPDLNLEFDTLVIADFGQRVPVMISHLVALGVNINKIKIVGLSVWNNSQIKKSEFVNNSYFATLTNTNEHSFIKEYNQYYNNELGVVSITAYDSVVALLSLFYIDDEGDLVIKLPPNKISNMKLKGIAGDFQINKNKTTIRDLSIRQIDGSDKGIILEKSINHSNLEIDFVKIKRNPENNTYSLIYEKDKKDFTYSMKLE